MVTYKNPRCGLGGCRSTKFEILDGFKFCKRCGLQQEGTLQTQQAEDEFGSQGQTTKKKRETVEKASRIYKGGEAIELFLQCYQLILWKQCYSLIHSKGLPPEIESVIRDLWALRLQLVKTRIGGVPDSDGETTVYSSQVEGVESGNETAQGDESRRSKSRNGNGMPALIDTLALCYLGMVLLRVPISMGDLHRWATLEEIPYIRAIRLIPRTMRSKLLPHYIGALDPRSVLQPNHVHMACQRMATIYTQQFGLVFPALNYPPLVLQYIQELALPLDIHIVVKRISTLLSCSFTFPKPSFRQRISSLPETQLVCILVVAVKLYHPFDDLRRSLGSSTEMGMLTIDWDTWINARKEYDAGMNADGRPNRDKDMNMTERDVFTMSTLQMDDYLDWYEKTWIDDEDKDRNARAPPEQLLNMFPTGRLDGSIATNVDINDGTRTDENRLMDKLKVTQRNLKVRKVILEVNEGKHSGPVRRIGSFYKRYRQVADLPAQAKVFYEAAAGVAGVSLSTLVKAVYKMETNLHHWRDEQKKKKKKQAAEKENVHAADITYTNEDRPDLDSDSPYLENDNL